jgi:hypothetical protein
MRDLQLRQGFLQLLRASACHLRVLDVQDLVDSFHDLSGAPGCRPAGRTVGGGDRLVAPARAPGEWDGIRRGRPMERSDRLSAPGLGGDRLALVDAYGFRGG